MHSFWLGEQLAKPDNDFNIVTENADDIDLLNWIKKKVLVLLKWCWLVAHPFAERVAIGSSSKKKRSREEEDAGIRGSTGEQEEAPEARSEY